MAETFYFDSVSSTMDKARELLPGKDSVLVVSEAQTKGRGRNGACWISKSGAGLYLTLGLTTDKNTKELAPLSMMVGVILAREIERFGLNPELKWPNDLLIDGKKLAGILIENSTKGAISESVYLGIGINLRRDGIYELPEAVSLEELLDELPDSKALAEAIAGRLEREIWELQGWAKDWSRFSVLSGREISFLEGSAEVPIQGRVLGVTSCGNLRVRLLVNSEEKVFNAASIRKIRVLNGTI